LKEPPYLVDLSVYFQDVDSLLGIAFQIALHNCRKHVKSNGDALPPSICHRKGKKASLLQGDGTQGASTTEILEKKQEDLGERRKRKRDEMVHTWLLFCCLC